LYNQAVDCKIYRQNNNSTRTMNHQNPPSGIADALTQAGNQAQLAERLGVSQQAISIWLRRGWVPVRRALEIEAQFGIPRSRLISPRLADLVDLPSGGV
jgi:transcriptional regulator with XRE-family HTH domain